MLARSWDRNYVWTKKHTADILTLHERVITLVLGHQQRLVGDVPFHLKFALKVTHPFEKRPLRPISTYKVWTVRGGENLKVDYPLSNEL